MGELGGEGKRRTVIDTEADVDGGREDVGGEDAAEEDGDVEEEVVLEMGSLGGLHVDVCEEGLDVDPVWAGRGKGVGEEEDGEGVGGGCCGCGDGGVEVVRGVEGVEGGDEESTHRGNK